MHQALDTSFLKIPFFAYSIISSRMKVSTFVLFYSTLEPANEFCIFYRTSNMGF